MARPHLTRIGWTFRRAMASWRLRIRRALSRRLSSPSLYWSRYPSRFKQPAVFVPLRRTGMVEANVQVVGEPASRALPDRADAIIREARQALLDASTLAPLEDVVLRGASVKAVVANRSGERYVVTVRRSGTLRPASAGPASGPRLPSSG